MQQERELHKIFFFLQGAIYISICLEIFSVLSIDNEILYKFQSSLRRLAIYNSFIYSKIFTIILIIIVSIGTKPKKQLNINVKKSVILPLILGLIVVVFSIYFFNQQYDYSIKDYPLHIVLYIVASFLGMLLLHISLDNTSKIIKSSFMKDRFNVENESFEQSRKISESASSVNIPMLFYFKKKVNSGWINIVNIYRATMVIGTPGSGKTFGVIIPFIKQLINKGFTMLVYDYKHPDLTKLSYYYYKRNKKRYKNFKFHVINLNDVEYSRRVNPLKPEYITTLAEASETAETLVHSLQKTDRQKGADQFFTQSAINFLSATIYYFAKYEDGKFSTFPHILYFISQDYEDIFNVLYSNDELEELLSIFKNSFVNKSFGQLDGQIGTLRTNILRLASKELAWIFSGDDINLKMSDRDNPSIIVIANKEETQSINSASNALILNRIIKLVNTADNLPSAIIVDESPTIYLHKVEKLIATARSRKVAIVLGLQELPQLVASYGKDITDTITSVIGNIVSGSVRKRETLQWLQQIFGKIKQQKKGLSINNNQTTYSINETLDYMIPESKISNLNRGEVVAQISSEEEEFSGEYKNSNYNCKISLNVEEIKKEEKLYNCPAKYYNFVSLEEKNLILKQNYNRIKTDIKMLVLTHKS